MEMIPREEETMQDGMVGKPNLTMSQLLSGIGKSPGNGSETMQPPATAPDAEKLKSEGISPAAQAGIQAGTDLIGQLMASKAQREANLLQAKQKAMESQSIGEYQALAQGGQAKQNALAKLIQSYRSALA